MRITFILIAVTLLMAMPSVTISEWSPGVSLHGPVAARPLFPSDLFGNRLSCARNSGSQVPNAISPLNLPADGTGAFATYDQASFVNNTAVNTTVQVPSGTGLFGALNTDQYLLLGVADPTNSTSSAFIGIGMTSELDDTIAVPLAILPNSTGAADFIYSTSNTVNSGNIETLEINYLHGDWWEFTYNGNPITGSSAWQNGTYNLGVSEASGWSCDGGARIGPSFLAEAWGQSGAATPTLPTTPVPWAVGVEPSGSSSTSYIPPDANAYPQFNKSQGTVGIIGHDQSSSIGIDQLSVGSSVSYPGAFAPLWGNYKVQMLNSSKITPTQATLGYNGTQIFNATALNQTGANLPHANYSWALSSPKLGTLNATSGNSVTLTAGSTTASGHIWANVSYNCSLLVDEANITVSGTAGPAIESFGASPKQVVVPPESDNTTTLAVVAGVWPFPISYKYTGLPAPCTSSNSTSIVCTPNVPGNYSVKVFLNDTKGHSSSATTPLLVDPDLSIVSFKDSPAELTVNTTTSINTTATGGIGPLIYNYTGMPPGCPNGRNTPVISCRPNATGMFNLTVFVNDSAGHSVNRTIQLVVNKMLSIANFTINPGTIQNGSSTVLTVKPAGGTPWSNGYEYSYLGLPKGCSSANKSSLTCVPSMVGNYTITANVTDSDGTSVQALSFLTVQPSSGPSITSFTADPGVVNVSQSTVLKVIVLGGVAPYSYVYAGLPGACSSANRSTLTCTPSPGEAGNYTIVVTVTDAKGLLASGALKLEVKNLPSVGPTISSFTANPSSFSLGSSTVLTVTATGGVGDLSYRYTGLPAGCSTANTSSLNCTPTIAGEFGVRVLVVDAAGHSANGSTMIWVAAPPPSISTFTVSPASVQVGSPANFSVVASGGSLPLHYVYIGLPAGCVSADFANLTCTPTSVGTYTVTVYVTDSVDRNASKTTNLTVTPRPAATLTSVLVLPSAVEVGIGNTTSLFLATPTCSATCPGTGITYSWKLSQPALGSLATPTSVSTTFTAGSTAGKDSLFVNATLNGVTKEATAVVTIQSPPLPTLVFVFISPPSINVTVGMTLDLSATVSCTDGTCPAGTEYAWTLNNSLGALSSTTGSSVAFTAGSNPGAVAVTVEATLNGRTISTNAAITIHARPTSSSGFLGFGGDTGYILVGVVVVVAGVVAILVLMRKLKPASVVPPPPPQPQVELPPPVKPPVL